MLTVSTVTDEQIDALWRLACGTGSHREADPDTMHLCTVAVNRNEDFTAAEQHEARGRCALILRERAPEVCRARAHRAHVADVCEANCCTSCGGPIDENEECRC